MKFSIAKRTFNALIRCPVCNAKGHRWAIHGWISSRVSHIEERLVECDKCLAVTLDADQFTDGYGVPF